MNPRERVRCALQCRVPDRIPMTLAFWEESVPGLRVTPTEHFGLDIRFASLAAPAEQDDFLQYLATLPTDLYIGDLTQLRTYYDWGYHPERPREVPLSHAGWSDDLSAYQLEAVTDPTRHAELVAQVEAWHCSGYAVAGGPPHLGGELFETAYRLRGFANFMSDLKLHHAAADYLLDQLTVLAAQGAMMLARAGIDILLLDDDVAMPSGLIISLPTWRRFFKSRLAAIIRVAREAARLRSADSDDELLVFYHSDGDFTALVPELAEIGVNAINPIQPDCMDALALKRQFGDRLALWGTVGTAALWDLGKPDEIRAEVRQRIATLGPAGLLLCPAYDLDFTPLENIEAFAEAVRRYGVT